MQIDVELALVDSEAISIEVLQDRLPHQYFAEDRSEKGWGLVIRSTRELQNDTGTAINSFLLPLRPLTDVIKKAVAVLRIGAFCDTVTCTIRIEPCIDLVAMGISLEISTYPCSNENTDESDS